MSEYTNFFNHIHLKPKTIIDIGACWVKYLLLAKAFPKIKYLVLVTNKF